MSVDAGFDVDFDTTEGREAAPKAGKKKFKPVNFDDFYKRYAYVAKLIDTYPELRQYYQEILDYSNKHRGQMPPADWLKERRAKNPWFQARDANQQEFDFAREDPNQQRNVETVLRLNRDKIVRWAAQRGIEIPDDQIEELALDATRNKWADDQTQLELNLGVFLGTAGQSSDLRGTAGDFQTDLRNWARKNGIALSEDALAQYVQRLTLNQQTIDDAKQEIRETYMIGAYPAWSDHIEAGFDIADIAAPYRSVIANGLEQSEDAITLDDPLMKKIFQAVGPDGKPVVVPIYEAERMMRQDSRWPKTNNAYAIYTDVGTDLLKMFGFR